MLKSSQTLLRSLVLICCCALTISSEALAIDIDPSCIQKGEHSSLTYFLIDRSDELEDIQNLKQSLLIAKQMIKPGERVLVGISAGKASQTRVIMDFVRPVKSIWVSKLKIRAAEKKFDDCYASMEKRVLVQNETHKSSALIETLGVVSKALNVDSSKTKRVIVFSDMIQNSESLSFYGNRKVQPAQALKLAEKENLLVDFKGVDFHVAGVGTGVSDKKARAIEEFWKQYIAKAGGKLKNYAPVLFTS